jgi:CheY-like chemotaxis protein
VYESPSILIIEDDAAAAGRMHDAFARLGLWADVLHDPQHAWHVLAAATRLPDLIVLDGEMTRLHGQSLVARMRAHPRLRSVPVVLVISAERSRRSDSDFHGSTAWVVKPRAADIDGMVATLNARFLTAPSRLVAI